MGAYEYVMTATEGTLYQYNAAGEATELGKNVFNSVGSDDGAKMTVVVDKVGTMKVYEDGEQVKDADGTYVLNADETATTASTVNATVTPVTKSFDHYVLNTEKTDGETIVYANDRRR
jgi:hypothetical protein